MFTHRWTSSRPRPCFLTPSTLSLGAVISLLAVGAVACSRPVERYNLSSITIEPSSATLAPGESLQFVVRGSDGQVRFRFANGVASSGTAASVNAAGLYLAGATGLVTDEIEVSDSSSRAVAKVKVTAALSLSSTTPAPAPGQTVLLAAGGGKAPYVFALVENKSGGSIDPLTGAYVAGRVGSVTDVVSVTDSAGQTRSANLVVGANLSAAFFGLDVQSGLTNTVVGTGGLPPYRFGFAAKGNHSRGAINQQTGDYTPGFNVLTTDTLEVSDATGAKVLLNATIPPLTLPVQANGSCVGARLRGDGRTALVSSLSQNFSGTLSVADIAVGKPASVSKSTVAAPVRLSSADVDGDGFDELAFSTYAAIQIAIGSRFQPFSSTFNVVAPQGFIVFSPQVLPGAVYYGFLYPPGTRNYLNLNCPAGIAKLAWQNGAFLPPALVKCTYYPVLAGGDFNGDGQIDLVGLNKNGFDYSLDLNSVTPAFVSGTIDTQPLGELLDVQAVALSAGGKAVSGLSITGQVTSALLRCQNPLSCSPWTQTNLPSVSNLTSVPANVSTRTPLLMNLSSDGALQAFSVQSQFALLPLPFTAPNFPVGCAAALDVDGDGLLDLSLSAANERRTTILFGEGDGTFGRRSRFNDGDSSLLPDPGACSDIDGDGVSDCVTVQPNGTVSLYFGQSHEFGFAGSTRPVAESGQALLGNFFGAPMSGAPASSAAGVYLANRKNQLAISSVSQDGLVGTAVALTLSPALPTAPTFTWLSGNFGGVKGPTFAGDFAGYQGSKAVLLTRTGATTATSMDLPNPPVTFYGVEAFDFNADSIDDLVASSQTDVWVSESARGTSGVAFKPWRNLYSVVSPGYASSFGTQIVGRGSGAYYALGSVTSNDPAQPSYSDIVVLQSGQGVRTQRVPFAIRTAVVGRLDGSGKSGLAAIGNDGRIRILVNREGTFSEAQTSPQEQLNVNAQDLRLINLGGATDDILVSPSGTLIVRGIDGLYR